MKLLQILFDVSALGIAVTTATTTAAKDALKARITSAQAALAAVPGAELATSGLSASDVQILHADLGNLAATL